MRIGSISGSLQRLVDNTSYLIAGTNVTIASSSAGNVTISSTGGGGGGGGYELAFNSGSPNLIAGVLSVTHGLSDDYVHVSVYDDTDHQIIPNEVIITGIGTLDIDLSSYTIPASPDWHVFITSATAAVGATPGAPDNSVQYNSAGSFAGSSNFTYDSKLSLTGSLLQFNGAGDTVGFMGDEIASSPTTIGTDVYFFVSGSSGSMGTAVRGVAAFGGDVIVTGSLKIGTGSILITNDYIQFGNSNHKITKSGNDLVFYDVNIPAGVTLSALNTPGGSGSPAGSNNSIQFNDAGSFGGSIYFTYSQTAYQLYITGSVEQGASSKATGIYSHAEGQSTIASGNGSHSEGLNTIASNDTSHAEGQLTVASGYASHAEGTNTLASNLYSHAEGYYTTGSNLASHAEGFHTLASGYAAHAEGYYTTGSGQFSHAEGYYTVAEGDYQHASGKYNLRGNTHSLLVIGNGTGDDDNQRSDILRVETQSIQVSGSLWQKNNGSNTIGFMGDDSGVPASKGTDVFFYTSGTIGSKGGATPGVALFGGDVIISGSTFIEGNQLEIAGTLSVTQGISGSLTQLTDGTSYIIAGANTTVVSQSNGSITISSIPSTPTDSVQYNSSGIFAGSSNFTYNGTQVFVGGTLRVGNSAVANGTNSIASGEGSALGAYTVAHGKITEARGENSFAHGQGTVTYANATHAEGLQTHASEPGSHAEGWLTVSSGSYSHAEGIGTIASGSGQHVEGKYNIRGNDHSLLVIGNGTDTMDSTRSDVIRVEVDGLQLSGSLWQTNSGSSTIGFMGNDSGSPQILGTDVFFYASGSKSSKDGQIPTVALFGGDVVISGTLHGGSPLKVGSGLVITGSLNTTQYYAGEVESVTATGAISTTKHTTKFSSTTGAYSLTLADGNTEGQLKYLVCGSITGGAGGTIDVTPDTIFGDWTYLAFSSYDSATLMWVGNGWAIVNVYGANPSFPS